MSDRRERAGIVRLFFAAGLFAVAGGIFAAVVTAAPAHADVFSVADVEVDARADSAAQARDKAIEMAQRQAFERLIGRLTLPADSAKLPPVDTRRLNTVVSGFEVEEEKRSTVRYIGRLTVHFNPDAVRAYLRRYDVPFSETQARPFLLLPVYEGGGTPILWQEPNPWWDAWAEEQSDNSLFPFTLPERSFDNITTVSANSLLFGRYDDALILAERYDAADVLVAFAKMRLDEESGRPVLSVHYTWLGRSYPSPESESIAFRARSWDERHEMLTYAAGHLSNVFEDQWKRQTLLDFSTLSRIRARIPIASLKQWVDIRSALESTAQITEFTMESMTIEEVRVRLAYIGDWNKLRVALAQRQMELLETEDAAMILYRAPRQPRQTGPAGSGAEGEGSRP